MVLIDDRLHHLANLESLLSAGVGFIGQDVADARETLLTVFAVDIIANVALDRVASLSGPGESFARLDVSVVVMTHQNVTRFIDVFGPVLCLSVQAHDAVVAADALVIFGGDAAGIIQRAFSGQDHGGFGRHHQDAASVHEHGGFGVPIRLGSDVDAVHEQVDFAARLRELDEPPQDTRNPVHVLDAAVHRNLCACGDGEPFQRDALLLGQIQRRQDALALCFGEGAKILAGIAQQHDAGHTFGIASREVADHAHDNVRLVLAVWANHGDEVVFGIEIVFHKFARRKLGPGVLRRGCEHPNNLVWVNEATLAHADNFLFIFGQRF